MPPSPPVNVFVAKKLIAPAKPKFPEFSINVIPEISLINGIELSVDALSTQ